MTARFHRNTREAFASERAPALFGPYRKSFLERPIANRLLWVVSVGLLVGMVYAPALLRAIS